MAFKISTGLATALAGTSSLKGALDGGSIRLYSGAVPNGADDALGAAALLCELKLDGVDPLVLTHSATNVTKPTGADWSGTSAATGVASFFRWVKAGDTGASSTSDVRLQGTVGVTNFNDMTLIDANMTSGVAFALPSFMVQVPLAA